MEVRKLSLILKGTIDPNQRASAEEQLLQIHKIIGFAPALLQVVISNDIELPVRQAGAVYLKNLITQNWIEKEAEPGAPIPFSIHEQDRGLIRESIVEAVIHSPEIIQSQLAVCVHAIVKYDFPGRWTQIVDKISIYIQNPDGSKIYGALLCLLQLVKNFEHKKGEHRAPLDEAMILLLPMLRNLMLKLSSDHSEQSVLLQKVILKIFFSLIQFNLSQEVITKAVFSQWMEIFREIIDRPVPEETNSIEEDERGDLIWWKCKKWALHILVRVYERYGSPSSVTKNYKAFANWYLTTFSAGIIEVLFKILDKKRKKEFVAPKVLQDILNYITQTISHAHTWKFLKIHMNIIIQEILFPLMCHTDEDEALWVNDPQEYIRVKFDVYDEIHVSNSYSAQNLLHTACLKRKSVLPNTLQFVLHIVETPNIDPKQKDGALAMIGSIVDILVKKKMYKSQMEKMLCVYVFPEFSSPYGFMRARACWTLNRFAENVFQDEEIKLTACRMTITLFLTDKETRVKLEAANALNSLFTYQENTREFALPQIKNLTLELLRVINETKNDEVTNVLQKIICIYPDIMTTLAVEICQQLASTFSNMVNENDYDDEGEYSLTCMSILNTMETLLNIMEDKTEIIAQMRPIILQVACHILTQNTLEYFEESLSLIYELTCKEIPPELWNVLELIYEVFQKDGQDYFTDMMPSLHNYVTVDTNAFLSNENYVLAIYNMCKTVLTSEMGEDPECHAAKLLEVIILQCKGKIDQCIPTFVELVLQRLTREIKTSELRIMCLQVVIAALYYNPPLLLETLNKLQLSVSPTESITSHFIRQWIHDADCFLGLHDRKICVVGLCTLMMLPEKPSVLNECTHLLIPSLILLFQGLKRAYAVRAQEISDDESDSDEEESEIEEELSSDEDENDESTKRYFDYLDDVNDQDDSDDDFSTPEETPLESYTTPLDDEEENENSLDEYIYFKQVLLSLQECDPSFYSALTLNLSDEQRKQLHDIMILADQRKAAAESKKIEQRGGYVFVQQSVPTSFNFGGSPLGQ